MNIAQFHRRGKAQTNIQNRKVQSFLATPLSHESKWAKVITRKANTKTTDIQVHSWGGKVLVMSLKQTTHTKHTKVDPFNVHSNHAPFNVTIVDKNPSHNLQFVILTYL